MCDRAIPPRMSQPSEEDLERQKKREADAVQNGIGRLVESLKHRRATDSKPVQDLMAIAWQSLVEAIDKEQLALQGDDRQKLPKYGAALLCLRAEAMALITIGILLNVISQSEADEDVPPPVTTVSDQIRARSRSIRTRYSEIGRAHV